MLKKKGKRKEGKVGVMSFPVTSSTEENKKQRPHHHRPSYEEQESAQAAQKFACGISVAKGIGAGVNGSG